MALSPFMCVPGLEMARSGGLIVSRWGTVTTMPLLEHFAKAQKAVIGESGHVSSVILLPIVPGEELPKAGDDVKKKVSDNMKLLGLDLLGTATVVMGSGMQATIVRTFMTGLNLFAKSPAPMKTVSTVDEALKWIGGLPRGADDVKGVTADAILRHFRLTGAGLKAA